MTVDRRAFEVISSTAIRTEQGLVVMLRLRNDVERALHYIADVRAIKYDSATRCLEVRLSDEGRVVIPGAANVHPEFRVIDPGAEAELTLALPEEIIMLAPPPDPEKKLGFQKHRIADAERIEVVIAWSDTPYYEGPPAADDRHQSAARWQRYEARAVLERQCDGSHERA